MYSSNFGLRHRPFPATPDTACYYRASGHERALARLLGGLEDGEGLVVLSGAPGTGKTLLCHCLLERLAPDIPNGVITNTHTGDRVGLLQAILFELRLPYEGFSEQEMRLALTGHLLNTFSEGGRSTVLVVDEAHHLDEDLLEELRLLGNLEGRAGKAVQVVLSGQSSLLGSLRRPELAAVRQRVGAWAALEPLAEAEAGEYLLHHLRRLVDWPESILDSEAVEVLVRGARGVPRLLGQAAQQALRLAAEAGAQQVDAEAALEALAILELDRGEELPAELPDLECASAVGGEKQGRVALEDADHAPLGIDVECVEDEAFIAPRRTA